MKKWNKVLLKQQIIQYKCFFSPDYVKPVCLPLSDILSRSSFSGSQQVVAGWGRTENCEFFLRNQLNFLIYNFFQFTSSIEWHQTEGVVAGDWERKVRAAVLEEPQRQAGQESNVRRRHQGTRLVRRRQRRPPGRGQRRQVVRRFTEQLWKWNWVFEIFNLGTSLAWFPSAPRTAARRTCPVSTREWPHSCPGSWTIWKRECIRRCNW